MDTKICLIVAAIENNEMKKKDLGSPKDYNSRELWAHLKIKYKDGDEFVDNSSLIWDVWEKDGGYVLYCIETKEIIEVHKPKELGG